MKDSSRVFTVILVIIIALILGLIIFLTFNVINQFDMNGRQGKAASEYENAVEDRQIIYKNEEEENRVTVDTNLVEIPSSDPDEEGSEGGSRKVIKYNGYTVVGTISIPSTNIKYPILQDLSKSSIENGIAVMYTTTSNNELNKPGNVVLAGHNYRDGTFFSNNKKLKEGDKIYITDNSGEKVTYVIYNTYVTTPEDFDYATRPTEGRREISLTTCTDDVKSRLIIWASAD